MPSKRFNYSANQKLNIKRGRTDENGNLIQTIETGEIVLGNLLSNEGGEGDIYKLLSINPSEPDVTADLLVAKIYHDKGLAKSKQSKILKMLDMLYDLDDDEDFENVCWPYYAIYDGNEFVGFLMQKAIGKTLGKLFYPDFKENFPHYNREDLVHICLKIIERFKRLHKYNVILGDINEDNFVINSRDEIYFIDTDSYQVGNERCQVERPEYKAPELIEGKTNKLTLETEGYSLCILLFKILMLGKHPFVFRMNDDSQNTGDLSIEERIVRGMFPYSLDTNENERRVPPGFYLDVWNDFAIELKQFFIDIFTRKKSINSADEIKSKLEKYLEIIKEEGKLDLIPTSWKKPQSLPRPVLVQKDINVEDIKLNKTIKEEPDITIKNEIKTLSEEKKEEIIKFIRSFGSKGFSGNTKKSRKPLYDFADVITSSSRSKKETVLICGKYPITITIKNMDQSHARNLAYAELFLELAKTVSISAKAKPQLILNTEKTFVPSHSSNLTQRQMDTTSNKRSEIAPHDESASTHNVENTTAVKHKDSKDPLIALSENECKFATYEINKIFEKVGEGTTNLTPGVGCPKNIRFINALGDDFFARIKTIFVLNFFDVFSQEQEKLIDEAKCVLAFKDDKTKKRIVLVLDSPRESDKPSGPEYIYFENYEMYNGTVPIYNISEEKKCYVSNSEFADILLPYYKYYSLSLEDENNKSQNQTITIDIKTLVRYQEDLAKLAPDESRFILPIVGESQKFSEIQIELTRKGKTENRAFFGGLVAPLNSSEEKDVRDSLTVSNKNISFVKLDCFDLSDNEQFIIKGLLNNADRYEKIRISHNISGTTTRTDRILDGIKACLNGQVENENLVKLICSGNSVQTGMLREYLDENKYIPNEKYIAELKEKYKSLRENEEQIRAIDKIAQMSENETDLMIIQGPPGTGKTELILSLIKELYSKKDNILVSSNVHVACDNIVDRFKNCKDIPLKRYTTTKGDDYEKEILENQQKYIEKQVLAGFTFSLNEKDIVLQDQESLEKIVSLQRENQDKINQLETKKNELLLQFESTKDLENEETDLKKQLDLLKKQITSLTGKISRRKKDLALTEKEFSQSQSKHDSLLSILQTKQTEKNEKEAEKERLNSELKKLQEKKTSLGFLQTDSVDVISQKENEIANLKKALDAANLINENFIKTQVQDYLTTGTVQISNGYTKKFYDEIFSSVFVFADFVNSTKEDLKNEKNFLNSKKPNLSKETFYKLYFKAKANAKCLKLFNPDFASWMEEVKKFTEKSSWLKKKMAAIFPFIKIEGNNFAYYQEKVNSFYDELRTFYNQSAPFMANKLVENFLNKSNLEKEKQKIEKKIDDISESITSLTNINKEISEKTYEFENICGEFEKINYDFDQFSKEQGPILKQLDQAIENGNGYIQNKSKEIEIFEKELEEAKTQKKDLDTKLNNLHKDILAVNDRNSPRVKKLKAFEKSTKPLAQKYQKNLEIIKEFLDTFNEKINSLKETGWQEEDAKEALYGYVREIKQISELDLNEDGARFENCVKGRGSAFRDLFELSNKDEGSVVSMTTSQVATLLRNDNDLTFDYAIIDEASKCTFEDIVISLPKIKHLVLIGDFMQLDKLYDEFESIEEKYKDALNYSEDLWASLNTSTFYQVLSKAVSYNKEHSIESFDENPMVAVMKRQYRMNKGIFELVKPIYEIHKELQLIDQKQKEANDLLCLQIDGDEETRQTADNKTISNKREGDAVAEIVHDFSNQRSLYPGIKTIGVITGYRAQENYIRKSLKDIGKIPGLEIGTFDRFQGKEFDLVIISLVRTEKLGFIENVRRMNVAISRAKEHLIIVGNFDKLNFISKKLKKREDCANPEEEEFVRKRLIPQLNRLKKDYPSDESMRKAISTFLLEENNEQ